MNKRLVFFEWIKRAFLSPTPTVQLTKMSDPLTQTKSYAMCSNPIFIMKIYYLGCVCEGGKEERGVGHNLKKGDISYECVPESPNILY